VVDEPACWVAAGVAESALDGVRGLHEEREFEVAEQWMLDRGLLLREGAACVEVEALARPALVIRVPGRVRNFTLPPIHFRYHLQISVFQL
jgi:hypothetical protein